MKPYTRRIMIVSVTAIAVVLRLAAALFICDTLNLRYWFTAKTGLFYPEAQNLETISDIEQMWIVSFPEGSHIEKLSKTKYTDYSNGSSLDIMGIKYKPYSYGVRVTIPSEKTKEFLDSVRKNYADTTFDGFGKKSEISFPEIMSDFQDKEFTYEFCRYEFAPTEPNDCVRIPMYRDIYVFEEEDKTTVYLSV